MEVHEKAMRNEFYEYFNGFSKNPVDAENEHYVNDGFTSHVWIGELMNGKREL